MRLRNVLVSLAGLSYVFAAPALHRPEKRAVTRTLFITHTVSPSPIAPQDAALVRKPTTTAKGRTTIRTTTSTRGRTVTTTATATVQIGNKRTTTTTARATRQTAVTSRKPSTTTSAAGGKPTKSTGKRGLAFNDPSLTQEFSLSGQGSKVNWAYNWASSPYYGTGASPGSFNNVLKYIPMLWSDASDLTSIWSSNVQTAISSYGADAAMAFNEPDGCGNGGSCMTVAAAVSAYKAYMQPLSGKVQLGAPAVTNAQGSGVGLDYLSQFISACTGCRIDFIPIHWYGSVLDPGSFESYVQSVYTKYRKPIWVTEFAPTSGTDAQIVSFLQKVLPWLDKQSYVKRYAYFMDRAAGSPYLLNTDNTLTDIGVEYNSG